MAKGSNTGNRALVPGSEQALDTFKYQVAREVGINQAAIQDGYWGELSSRACGKVGGTMVKRMIQLAEQALAQGQTPPVETGVTGGIAGGTARSR